MKAFSQSRPAFGHPFLLIAFALLAPTACATTRTVEKDDPSDVELVDIGYGMVDKDHVVGGGSTVQSEDSRVVRPRTWAEMLRLVPGVMVAELPGGDVSVRIRGVSSFQGGRSPLFVMDGMIIQGVAGINPNTVESLTVLKNADATAVYGSRGANGVILIQSKKGWK